MIASSAGHLHLVRLLLEHGTKVNAVNNTGQSPLHYASSKNRLEVYTFVLFPHCLMIECVH